MWFGLATDLPEPQPGQTPSPFLVVQMFRGTNVVAKQKTAVFAQNRAPDFNHV